MSATTVGARSVMPRVARDRSNATVATPRQASEQSVMSTIVAPRPAVPGVGRTAGAASSKRAHP